MAIDSAEDSAHDGQMGQVENGENVALLLARNAARLTLEQLALRIGVSQSQMSRFGNGHRDLPSLKVGKLSVVLNIPVEDLIPGSRRASETAQPSEAPSPDHGLERVGAPDLTVLKWLLVGALEAAELQADEAEVLAASLLEASRLRRFRDSNSEGLAQAREHGGALVAPFLPPQPR